MDVGIVALLTTELLSTKTFAGLSRGTPIILSLQRRVLISSVPTLKATNSEPNVDVSTVHCALEYQMIGALFK
jgi:hypothetical protein